MKDLGVQDGKHRAVGRSGGQAGDDDDEYSP